MVSQAATIKATATDEEIQAAGITCYGFSFGSADQMCQDCPLNSRCIKIIAKKIPDLREGLKKTLGKEPTDLDLAKGLELEEASDLGFIQLHFKGVPLGKLLDDKKKATKPVLVALAPPPEPAVAPPEPAKAKVKAPPPKKAALPPPAAAVVLPPAPSPPIPEPIVEEDEPDHFESVMAKVVEAAQPTQPIAMLPEQAVAPKAPKGKKSKAPDAAAPIPFAKPADVVLLPSPSAIPADAEVQLTTSKVEKSVKKKTKAVKAPKKAATKAKKKAPPPAPPKAPKKGAKKPTTLAPAPELAHAEAAVKSSKKQKPAKPPKQPKVPAKLPKAAKAPKGAPQGVRTPTPATGVDAKAFARERGRSGWVAGNLLPGTQRTREFKGSMWTLMVFADHYAVRKGSGSETKYPTATRATEAITGVSEYPGVGGRVRFYSGHSVPRFWRADALDAGPKKPPQPVAVPLKIPKGKKTPPVKAPPAPKPSKKAAAPVVLAPETDLSVAMKQKPKNLGMVVVSATEQVALKKAAAKKAKKKKAKKKAAVKK